MSLYKPLQDAAYPVEALKTHGNEIIADNKETFIETIQGKQAVTEKLPRQNWKQKISVT